MTVQIEDRDADRRMVASTLTSWLPQALFYPLRGHGALTILLITLLLGLGLRGPVALIALILGTLWTAHYAIRVIEHTSLGHATPPRLTGDALMLASRSTWAALLAPALLLTLYLRDLHAVFWPLALLLPAHWIALGTTRSLIAACHPLRLLQIVALSSPTYLIVCALLACAAWLGRWLQYEMGSLLLIAIWLYLLFAGCHLLGFMAYLRHERLGVGVQVLRPTQAAALEVEQNARLDALMERLKPLHAAREYEAAARLMLDTAPGPADARRFHEQLHERLKAASMRGLALTQAARMIAFLLDRKLVDRALDIFENALDLDSRFRVESALQLAPLAERALDTHQHALLARLLDAAQTQFAGDPALRLLDLVRVREAFDHRRDEAATRALLAGIGPLDTHPQSAALRAYAQALAVPRAPAAPAPPVPRANSDGHPLA